MKSGNPRRLWTRISGDHLRPTAATVPDQCQKALVLAQHIARLTLFAVLTVALQPEAFAQSETGFPPFSSVMGGVNLLNLNVHGSVSVLNRSGRKLPLNIELAHDSTIYSVNLSVFVVDTNAGWTVPVGLPGRMTYTTEPCPTNAQATNYTNWAYVDMLGTVHSVAGDFGIMVSTDPNCGPAQASAYALDQSGFLITAKNDGSGIVQDPSGNTINLPPQFSPQPTSFTDSNGNVISSVTAANGVTTITDTLGSTSAVTISYTVDPNSLKYQTITYTYPAPGGGTASVVVNYKSYPRLASGFGCPNTTDTFYDGSGLGGLFAGVSLPDNIVLADGSTYKYTYEPTPTSSPVWVAGAVTGRITSTTLPTGASISYAYPGPNGGIQCPTSGPVVPALPLLHLSVTTSDGTWKYDRTTGFTSSTTITDPQGNQTVVTFTNGHEAERQVYQGDSTHGTLLRTLFTCYNGGTPSTTCVNVPRFNPRIVEVSTFVLLPSGAENEKDVFLDEHTGLVREVDEYDFGINKPGPLLRKKAINYASLGNNILNRPQSITLCAPGGSDTACSGSGTSGGTMMAQTRFGYDETAPAATSNISQHVAVTGSRGNATTIHRWLNTSNTTLDTTNTYDDTGNLLTTIDPGGHQTSFTFGSSSCNGAFNTQTTRPDTHSPALAHHQTSQSYDCNAGVVSTTTDQNGNVTQYFYDNMFRPTEVDFPDGGQTKYIHWNPNQTDVQTKIDGSRNLYSATLLDGYGRVSRTATENGESNPWDQQDFCYDSDGRLAFSSYPYQGSGWETTKVCSGAGDTFTYDALGRPTNVTHSDGSFAPTTYAGNATQVTDEGNGSFNVSRILQRDGLGRLSGVCEITSSPLLGISPASCGMDIAGTGFLTSYGHDTLGNLTRVTQGSLTNRTYVYDSLSRMTSETTPEAGTVSYSYNADSLLSKRSRPTANQANPAVTTTTTYAYDEMHRLTSRTYSDSTPRVDFAYDANWGWGVPQTNTVGRIHGAVINPLGSGQYAEIFGYDAIGRVVLNYQCLPDVCPSGGLPVTYAYDLLGDVTSASNGAGTSFGYSYNIAGRLTGMTSSISDPNHPATLLSNAHYTPTSVTDTLGNGLLESTGFSARGQLLSLQITNGAASAAGTGSVLIGGSLQSQTQAAKPGTGSVTIAGSEQSKSGVGATSATYGNGSVTVTGTEGSTVYDPCVVIDGSNCPTTYFDYGSVSITFHGVPSPSLVPGSYRLTSRSISVDGNGNLNAQCQKTDGTWQQSPPLYYLDCVSDVYNQNGVLTCSHSGVTSYGQGSDATSVANGLAQALNGDGAGFVTASASNGVLQLTARQAGAASNYGWQLSAVSYDTNGLFDPNGSFANPPSSGALSGGQDGYAGSTIYDSGTCTVTLNGTQYSAAFGQGASIGSIASALAAAISAGNLASASASGATISLTATATGTGSNYSLGGGNCTFNSSYFRGASFSANPSGSSLAGGTNAVTTYDSGATTITVNNHPDSYSWSGSASTTTSIAQGLTTAINNDSASSVSASSNGATINLVAKTYGQNYPLSAASNSSQNSFSTSCPGFSSCSGANLTGATTVTPYSFSLGLAPDGQITSANDFVNGIWAFSYDQFNRLANSNKNSGQVGFAYGYDRNGNRWAQSLVQGGPGPAPQFAFDNNNHLVGATYDALGNETYDGFHGFTYDAENRVIQVDGGATAAYAYDAEGRRTHGPNGDYLYDLAGHMITQFGLNGVWNYGEIYAGGRHLATYSGGTTNFFHSDFVGTKRVLTAINGVPSETCTGFAFGDGVNCTGNGFNWSFNGFTDDIHDPETNLEHTLFRKYSSSQGRWTTPDPAGMASADPTNPQSWNRYAYVTNDPVNAIDPTGLDVSTDGFGVGLFECGTGSEGCDYMSFGDFTSFGPDGTGFDGPIALQPCPDGVGTCGSYKNEMWCTVETCLFWHPPGTGDCGDESIGCWGEFLPPKKGDLPPPDFDPNLGQTQIMLMLQRHPDEMFPTPEPPHMCGILPCDVHFSIFDPPKPGPDLGTRIYCAGLGAPDEPMHVPEGKGNMVGPYPGGKGRGVNTKYRYTVGNSQAGTAAGNAAGGGAAVVGNLANCGAQ